MKKLHFLKGVFVAAVLLFFLNTVSAQMYVDINIGYALKKGQATMSGLHNYTGGTSSYTEEQVIYSLGQGFNFGGAFGYMFNDNVGAELGLSYLMGAKATAEGSGTGWSDTYSFSSNMLRFIPAIVVKAGTDGVNPYAKFGAVIGAGSIMEEYEDNTGGDITIWKQKMNGGVAIGFTGALGAIFELSDMLSFYAEFNTTAMSYSPTKGEVTEASYKGQDQLPDMTTYQKETEYVSERTVNTTSPPPDSQASQELKYKHPFGSFGINAGVIINL